MKSHMHEIEVSGGKKEEGTRESFWAGTSSGRFLGEIDGMAEASQRFELLTTLGKQVEA